MRRPQLLIFLFAILITSCAREEAGRNAVQTEATPAPATEITDANTALAEGMRLLDINQTEQAIEAFKRAIEFDPDMAEAYFRMGIAYALLEAEAEVNAVAGETPAEPPGKGKKAAEIKTESEKAFEKAVEAYKKLLKLNPDDHVSHYNLGRTYNKLNDDEEAAKSLREAVELKPDDTEYQTELGAIYVKLAKYHEAVAALKKALELDPANTEAEELLQKAEAGRSRVDYVTKKKDEKDSRSGRNAETNANVTEFPANTAEPRPSAKTSPVPPKKLPPSANKP